MEFDIERAWKDETYRQTLSEEQLQTLPANPAGDLSEADLAAACGAWGPGWGGPVGVGVAVPVVSSFRSHESSIGLVCEVNVFTVNANVLIAIPIQLLSGPNSNCVGSH